ncbi:hypothetical protein PCASD_17274 [Puccinia coronata f. sp. avenae]|uniref:Integrase catalytic domain-containing protein n=1 Tax=Puccinia coronata f. sp. avenae TaxID=200324 RepID=A0A2N5U986_9BASI|nr:hypothetical protein PCASD_17274 [Puccinia coronata f. sp. avenae]
MEPAACPATWEDDNDTVCAILVQIVDRSNLRYFWEHADDAAGMWGSLSKAHQDSSTGGRVYWIRKLVNARMPGDDIDAHIDSLAQSHERLNSLVTPDKPLTPDDVHVAALLSSTPPDWIHCVSALMNQEGVKTETIVKALKNEAVRRESQQEIILVSSTKPKPIKPANPPSKARAQEEKPRCPLCNRNGHDLNSCNNIKGVIQEHKAAQKARWKASQPESLTAAPSSKPQTRAGRTSAAPLGNYAEIRGDDDSDYSGSECGVSAKNAVLALSSPPNLRPSGDPNLDSGCSMSMTPYIDLVENPSPNNTPVHLADHSVVEASHKGTLVLPINGSTSVTTLVVPSLHEPLLSIANLCDEGLTIVFKKSSCDIFNSSNLQLTGTLAGRGYCRGNLYYLPSHPVSQCSSVPTSPSYSDTSLLGYHIRFSHLGLKALKLLLKLNGIVPSISNDIEVQKCQICVQTKMHRHPFRSRLLHRSSKPGELIHSDVASYEVISRKGYRYFITFVDDHSKSLTVYPMKNKSDSFSCFKIYRAFFEKSGSHTIQALRTDNGGEYLSLEFTAYLTSSGIKHDPGPPHSPQLNAGFSSPNSILNLPSINLADIHPFGCLTWYKVPEPDRKKLDPKARASILLSYLTDGNGYRVWDLEKRSVIKSRDVIFEDQTFPYGSSLTTPHKDLSVEISWPVASPSPASPLSPSPPPISPFKENEAESPSPTHSSVDDLSFISLPDLLPLPPSPSPSPPPLARSPPRRTSSRQRPQITKQTSLVEGCRQRILLTTRSNDAPIVRSKNSRLAWSPWIFSNPSIDYDEVFSPTLRLETLRLILGLLGSRSWKGQQVDFKTAFLNGHLDTPVFMEQPPGFKDPQHPDWVCEVNRSLYGLKQSPRQWNIELHKALLDLRLSNSSYDPTLYFKIQSGKLVGALTTHVDDLAIVGEPTFVDDLISAVGKRFVISADEDLNHFLSIKITRDIPNRHVFLNQAHYIKEISERFLDGNSHTVSTPTDFYFKNLTHKTSSDPSSPGPYPQIIGSLLWISQCTRPDISFAVNKLLQYLRDPSLSHWYAAVRILNYLVTTADLKLRLGGSLECSGYSDSDWAEDRDDRRSTSAYTYRMGDGAISWKSRKQATVSLSSTEAEYKALSDSCKEGLWLRHLLTELHLRPADPIPVHVDNKGAEALAKNPEHHARTKHIHARYHFIRECIKDDTISLLHVSTADMLADMLTKPLSRVLLEKHRLMFGIVQ